MSAKASFGSLCLATCLSASVAHAHISLEMAGEYKSRAGDGDDELKAAPCGKAGAPRGSNVYTFEPGQTITIKLKEYVPHPGYFRIAFDNDGDDGFMEPQSIMPENRACMTGETRCGKTDFCNSPSVLLDNIEPHWDVNFAGGAIDRSWQVKLPDVECETCTLQIIQIMTDPPGHGPYDLMNDIYHQCIDVTLKRGSGMGANTGAAMNTVPMMECAPLVVAASGGAGAAGAGGMSGGTAGMSAAQAGSSGAPAMQAAGVAGMPSPAPTPPRAPTTTTAGAAGAMAAPVTAPAMPLPPPAAAPKESSGCSVAAGSRFDLGSLGWLGVALFALAPRRRASRQTTR